MSSVGVALILCSDIIEKPISSPPQAAKMKSKPTNIIISLVGILAVVSLRSGLDYRGLAVIYRIKGHWQNESKRLDQEPWKRMDVVCRQSRPASSRRGTINAWQRRLIVDTEKGSKQEVTGTAGKREQHGRGEKGCWSIKRLIAARRNRTVRNVRRFICVGGGLRANQNAYTDACGSMFGGAYEGAHQRATTTIL